MVKMENQTLVCAFCPDIRTHCFETYSIPARRGTMPTWRTILMKKISAKQQRILEYISEYTAAQGYPPSVREICAEVGLSSPSTVHSHLKRLRELGYLEKDDHKTRAISVRGGATMTGRVPILGKVTAGMPILAVEEVEGYVPYEGAGKYGEHFALRVSGESMIGAGIMDGDLIIVRKESTAAFGTDCGCTD